MKGENNGFANGDRLLSAFFPKRLKEINLKILFILSKKFESVYFDSIPDS